MRIWRSALSGGRHVADTQRAGGLRCKDFKKVSRWRISRQTEVRRARPGGSCLQAPRGVFRHCSCSSVLVPIALNEHQNSLRAPLPVRGSPRKIDTTHTFCEGRVHGCTPKGGWSGFASREGDIARIAGRIGKMANSSSCQPEALGFPVSPGDDGLACFRETGRIPPR